MSFNEGFGMHLSAEIAYGRCSWCFVDISSVNGVKKVDSRRAGQVLNLLLTTVINIGDVHSGRPEGREERVKNEEP